MTSDDGKMILSMEEMQTYGKSMLENIISIFDKHKIPYYAGFGTVLGAVRHADIIPWDHDIDLMVPISERERMIEVLKKELASEFHLWTAGDADYALWFTRVALTGMRHEFLHIDIYNIIGLPDSLDEQKRIMKRAVDIDKVMHNKYYLHFNKNNGFLINMKVLARKIQAMAMPEKLLRKEFETILHKWGYDSSDYITVPIKEYGMKKIFKKDVFGCGREMQFGSLMIRIPECYDAYLSKIYGDYRIYPPQKDRDDMLNRKWVIESL